VRLHLAPCNSQVNRLFSLLLLLLVKAAATVVCALTSAGLDLDTLYALTLFQLREESIRHGHVRQIGINSAYLVFAQGTHSRQMFIKCKVAALCGVV
jgi:hypothetical protein